MDKPLDTENKIAWCFYGRKKEDVFVDDICPYLGIKAIINPEKKTNVYAPDLIVDGIVSDLKYQGLPFFTAGIKWGKDPQYAVSFNCKDYERYTQKYPDINIYFWINWERTQFSELSVRPMWGVWEIPFPVLSYIIDRNPVVHAYERRTNDSQGNAKSSYILDVRECHCIKEEIYIGDQNEE